MNTHIKPSCAGLLATGALLLLGLQSAWGQIKVVCVGDSITAGYGLANPGTQSYPAQLQTILGGGYTVQNYGDSGRTLMKGSGYSYWDSWAYSASMNSSPNIVVIMLGTNDANASGWNATTFATDYHDLIAGYRALPTHPTVYICLAPPVYTNTFGFDPSSIQNNLLPAIQTVATTNGVTLIDNNTPLLNHPELYTDGVHPTAQGAAVIAASVADALTSVTLQSIGSAAPNPGPDDIYQLSTNGNTVGPDGINYFTDNNPPVGQTFTTGTNARILASVTIKTAGLNAGNGYGTPASTPTYYLRIYSMSGGTAALLSSFIAPNPGFTDGDWLQWGGLNLPLAANQTYAFSFGIKPSGGGWAALAVATNAYAGGEIAIIPISGGTVTTGGSHSFDAVFSLGLHYTAVQNWRFANFGTTSNSGNAADGADPDGDGWTNAQEYISGTDPNSRSSLLKIDQMQANGNDMLVSFPTVVGKTYRMERSDTLQTGSWTTVLDNIAGTGGTIQVTDTGGAVQPKRFYQIVVGS